MAETVYGIRKYTCSDKTKRPQKNPLDLQKLEKRNANQRRLYITLDNIDEIFSQNDDKYPVCYELIFNIIQGKVTKYFSTRSYDRKKELSYDCMNVLYSTLKRKLLRLKDNQGLLNPQPVLFFYLSQFFRYIELVVYSVVYYGTLDLKFIVQEPENFKTDDLLTSNLENFLEDPNSKFLNNNSEYNDIISIEINENLDKNRDNIKLSIERNQMLSNKEKSLLLKIYKNAYSSFGGNSLTKRDLEILNSIKERMIKEPELLKDLEEILLHA